MKIKMCSDNASKIEQLLKDVNGHSIKHTYNTFYELMGIVLNAEKEAKKLFRSNKEMKGIRYFSTSGEKVPKCYKYSRCATTVIFEYNGKDWFLIDVHRVTIFKEGGNCSLILTKEHDEFAVQNLRKKYFVRKDRLDDNVTIY